VALGRQPLIQPCKSESVPEILRVGAAFAGEVGPLEVVLGRASGGFDVGAGVGCDGELWLLPH
jgi:hypothetical protein